MGLGQWIRRKSLRKVDFTILALGIFYIATAAAFLFFENHVINYRPLLIGGNLEASYPSSTTLLAICVMLCGTATFELIPDKLLDLFNASAEMKQMGVVALRTIAIHFPIAAMGIIMSSIFQAFSKSFYSLFISLGRQLVILIPAAWLLSKTGNVNNVWWCFFIAEIASFILSLIFFRKVYRSDVSPIPDDGVE